MNTVIMCVFLTMAPFFAIPSNRVSSYEYVFFFKLYSCDLRNPKDTLLIDKFATLIKQKESVDKEVRIQVFSCEKEVSQDKYISYKRADKIISYIVVKYGVPREEFVVQDLRGDVLEERCIKSGLMLVLRKK